MTIEDLNPNEIEKTLHYLKSESRYASLLYYYKQLYDLAINNDVEKPLVIDEPKKIGDKFTKLFDFESNFWVTLNIRKDYNHQNYQKISLCKSS